MTERRKAALIEMAKRGTDAEKEIAAQMIKEHGIELTEKTEVSFAYKSSMEKKLILQIYAMMFDTRHFEYYTYKTKNALGFNLTEQERVEFELYYSIYRRELQTELDLTFSAFLQTNNIFPLTPSGDSKTLSSEERAKLFSRMNTIDKTHIRKQIGGDK